MKASGPTAAPCPNVAVGLTHACGLTPSGGRERASAKSVSTAAMAVWPSPHTTCVCLFVQALSLTALQTPPAAGQVQVDAIPGAPFGVGRLVVPVRGKAIDRDTLHTFIAGLDIPDSAREDLLALTPATYIGNAAAMARSNGD